MSQARAFVGTVEYVVCTFKIASTAALDNPTAVTVEVKAPSADAVTYTYGASGSPLLRRSTGVYYVPITYTEPGTWGFIWHAAGVGHPEGTQQEGRVVSARLFAAAT